MTGLLPLFIGTTIFGVGVIMDDKTGFNGAVNRGPAAFVNFLKHFESGLGVSVQDIIGQGIQKKDTVKLFKEYFGIRIN